MTAFLQIPFTSTVAITAGSTNTYAIALPPYRGLGAAPVFYFELEVLTGGNEITLTAKPIKCNQPGADWGRKLESTEYKAVAGAQAKQLQYYDGVSKTDFITIAMTTGKYMVPLDCDYLPWMGVEITIAASATAGTGTFTGTLTIG